MHHFLSLMFAVASVALPPRSAAELPFRWPFNGPLVSDDVRWQAGALDFYAPLPLPRPANPAPLWDPPASARLIETGEVFTERTSCWAGSGIGEIIKVVVIAGPPWSLQLPRPQQPPPAALFCLGNAIDLLVAVEESRTGSLLFGLGVSSDAGLLVFNPVIAAQDTASLLNHHDERVRLDSVRKLGCMAGTHVIEPLCASLQGDPCPAVRQAAIEALQLLDMHSAASLLQHTARFDPDLDVRRAASAAVEALKPRPTLLRGSRFHTSEDNCFWSGTRWNF